MTNAELIQKIRNEIERRKGYISVTHFAEELLSFLSTLESEKPMNQKGLEREIERCLWKLSDDPSNDELRMFARHFAKWQKEQMMKEAVDVQVVGEQRDLRLIDSTQRCLFNAKRGDWLEIIICKKED